MAERPSMDEHDGLSTADVNVVQSGSGRGGGRNDWHWKSRLAVIVDGTSVSFDGAAKREPKPSSRFNLRARWEVPRSHVRLAHATNAWLASRMSTAHLLIIDAQSLAGRAAAVSNGDVTGGARLWSQMARGAAIDIGATHIVAAWDHDGPTFRHAIFPSYKNSRTGSMRTRITPIRELVEATGIVSLSVDTYEGDDCVASLLTRFRAEARITVLSNDSDLLQFVSDGVDVATYVGVGKGSDGTRIKRWSSADVLTKFGVEPANLAAFKALCGEVGDDIPGVANIGKGTAVKLLRRWKSLDKALEASEFVSFHDITAKLAGQHEQVRLMLQLTTLKTDVPLPMYALAQCVLSSVNWPGGSAARGASVVNKTAAGPGLEDVPFPVE